MAPSKGRWLTQQMERRRISARQVAEALGVTPKTVYDWQNEKTAISEERLPRLAEVLEVSELELRQQFGFWVPPAVQASDLVRELEEELAELRYERDNVQTRYATGRKVVTQALDQEIERVESMLTRLRSARTVSDPLPERP